MPATPTLKSTRQHSKREFETQRSHTSEAILKLDHKMLRFLFRFAYVHLPKVQSGHLKITIYFRHSHCHFILLLIC